MANLKRLPRPQMAEYEWQFQGTCNGADTETFFIAETERAGRRRMSEAQAKAYCMRCPVIDECLDHALKAREPYGIWGGMTPSERQTFSQQRSAS